MNKVELIGRLVADPEVKYTQGNQPMCIARFRLAVDRRFHKEGEAEVDFIPCISFGKSGEFTEKYFKKGMKVAVTGRIQTGSYTNKDGVKVYTTDIVVEEQEFCESKQSSAQQSAPQQSQSYGDGFMNIPDGIDEELPFN